jgi:MFS superfamily sulfate permease-like transporter
MCHGAGGLAGQYRFGARTNGSILFLGGAKMIVAVLFGASLMALCRAFPASLLGVMLAFSGIELSLVTRDQRTRTDTTIMLLTAGACLGADNVAVGFVLGFLLAWALKLETLFTVERERVAREEPRANNEESRAGRG